MEEQRPKRVIRIEFVLRTATATACEALVRGAGLELEMPSKRELSYEVEPDDPLWRSTPTKNRCDPRPRVPNSSNP